MAGSSWLRRRHDDGSTVAEPSRALDQRQLWLFWLAPIAGALLGAIVHRALAVREIVGDAEIS